MADVITVDNAITLEARNLGFVDITEDQRYVVKQFLKGSDLFVSLPTGSGKSLCYWLLPGLCDTFRGRSGSLVLVKHVEALQAEVLRHVSTIGEFTLSSSKKELNTFPQKWKRVACGSTVSSSPGANHGLVLTHHA